VDRVKAMPRNAAAADDSYRPDTVHEDEPRYLRRQKPVEIRRKKFGGKSASSIVERLCSESSPPD
jgi:hypothetical protein